MEKVEIGCAITPEHELVVATIQSGARDKDIKYFEGDTFVYHCGILGLDYEVMSELILAELRK